MWLWFVDVAGAGRGKPRPYNYIQGRRFVENAWRRISVWLGIAELHPPPLFLCNDLNLKDLRYRLA